MRLSIIVAVADNGVIGREGDLPWRLSADLKRFKALTMGHHLLMGRRTFDSIGTALPGRNSVVISRGLPWRLSADLKRFKALTMGHHLLMGRKTFESIGTVLPGRTTVVISRGQPDLPAAVLLAHSLKEAVEMARSNGDDEAFVAGGAEIYAQALPVADRIYLTRVHAQPEGDTHFPAWQESDWREVSREDHTADERNAQSYSFHVFERV